MFIIITEVNDQTYYLQLYRGRAELNGLKDNAVTYASFQHALADVMIYKNKFQTELRPVAR